MLLKKKNLVSDITYILYKMQFIYTVNDVVTGEGIGDETPLKYSRV